MILEMLLSYFGHVVYLELNINGKNVILNGKVVGNVHSDRISIKSEADIDGVLNQKTLSIEEGARLKIKTETY